MATVILILQQRENRSEVVHEAHATWDTALQTIRETYSKVKGAKVTLGTKRVHGSTTRLPVCVTWVEGDEDKRTDFVLAEVDVQTEASHL